MENRVSKNCVSCGLPSSKPSSPATSSSVTSIRDSTAIVAGIGSSSEKLDFLFQRMSSQSKYNRDCLSPISNIDIQFWARYMGGDSYGQLKVKSSKKVVS